MRPIKRDYRMRVAKKRQRQGYDMYDEKSGHWSTVDPKTGKFLKSSDHPTVNKEIDWFYSDDPTAKAFRGVFDLKTKNLFGKKKKFYKYVTKKNKKRKR